ncbi:MAG: serine hydrolase [bacterium]
MRKLVVLLFYFLLQGQVLHQASYDKSLPLSVPDDQIRPLRQLMDADLQKRLETRLNQNSAWAKLIKQKKMAVGLVDLSDSTRIKFARVNGSVMMYAASLPKLAILLAAFQAFEEKSLEETPEILHDVKIMISVSDNEAATRMIDRMGFDKIASVLTDEKYKLYDPDWGGGLWVGKRYAHEGKRYPDPMLGLSHAATVTQVCRFYYLLAMGKLVSRERSRQMLDILEDPDLHHKFVYMYDQIVPEAKLYRKSGTWKQWHSDSVLIWGPLWRKYILATLVEDSDGERICRDLVPAVEEVLKSRLLSRTGSSSLSRLSVVEDYGSDR